MPRGEQEAAINPQRYGKGNDWTRLKCKNIAFPWEIIFYNAVKMAVRQTKWKNVFFPRTCVCWISSSGMSSTFRLHGPCSTAARSFLPVCVVRFGSTTFRILSKYVVNLSSLLYRINIFELFSIIARGSASNFIIYNLFITSRQFPANSPSIESRKRRSLSHRSRFLSERDHLLCKWQDF